jgi:hypothetical protein
MPCQLAIDKIDIERARSTFMPPVTGDLAQTVLKRIVSFAKS